MGGSTPPVHATFTLYPTPGPPPTWHQGGGRGYSHCLGTPDTAPTLSPPPALTPLTSALHGGAGGRRGPPPGALTPQEPAPLEAPCQVPFCSLPEGPRGRPGAVPLREPRSLERSSRCHSDAGRCRAQRGRCRRPAACRCRGECPGGYGQCFRKRVHTCPKVQISLTPQSHPMVSSGDAVTDKLVFQSQYHLQPMEVYGYGPGQLGDKPDVVAGRGQGRSFPVEQTVHRQAKVPKKPRCRAGALASS